MTSLSFSNVTYKDQEKVLLGPVNAEFDISGLTTVLGANGAGKSLFLELAHGIIQPTSGKLVWEDGPPSDTISNRGYVFQHRITLRRSVAQNIALPLAAANWKKRDIKNRTEELLEMSNLNQKANDPAAILSGGEAQRMALVRAMACKPKTLILDEPTSSMDPSSTEAFEKLIKSVANEGVNILWSTHNLAQAKRFANKVIFVAEGQISETCAAETFFNGATSYAAQQYLKEAR